jgi:hypothetical protein
MVDQVWRIRRGALNWQVQPLRTGDMICFRNKALGAAQLVFDSQEAAQGFCDRLNDWQSIHGVIGSQDLQLLQISAGEVAV